MTRATDCLDQMLRLLHEIEDKIEHEHMLNPDPRLTQAELAVHRCITDVERIRVGDRPADEPRCTGTVVHDEYSICPRCDS